MAYLGTSAPAERLRANSRTARPEPVSPARAATKCLAIRCSSDRRAGAASAHLAATPADPRGIEIDAMLSVIWLKKVVPENGAGEAITPSTTAPTVNEVSASGSLCRIRTATGTRSASNSRAAASRPHEEHHIPVWSSTEWPECAFAFLPGVPSANRRCVSGAKSHSRLRLHNDNKVIGALPQVGRRGVVCRRPFPKLVKSGFRMQTACVQGDPPIPVLEPGSAIRSLPRGAPIPPTA